MKCAKLAAFSLLTISCFPAWYSILANAILRRTPRLCNRLCNEHAKQLGRQKAIDVSNICNIKGGGNSDEGQDDNDEIFFNKNMTGDEFNDSPSSKPNKRREFTKYKSTFQERTLKAKESFLDKISLVSSALLKSEHDAVVDNKTEHSNPLLDDMEDGDENDNEITLQSDLLRPGRKMAIVTTASIPWFTGTSVNPLLRAAYLSRLTKKINNDNGNGTANEQMVTLVIPWLEMEEDRQSLYGDKYNFTTPEEQEAYIRNWLKEDAGMPEEADPERGIKILFYPSRYHSGLKSIFAMGDIISVIPDEDADVCILEEPEHLNWYRAPGDGWTKKFRFVIGIIHTNYVEYASSHYSGLWTAPAIRLMSSAMVRAYCHVVIKLSDTLQTFAEEKERTSNVHGVRIDFLKVGDRRATANHDRKERNKHGDNPSIMCNDGNVSSEQERSTSRGNSDVYFIGKLLWAKGLDKLIELENYYRGCTGRYFSIDVYGNGPQEKEIKKAFRGRNNLGTSQRNYRQEAEEEDLRENELSLSVDTMEESKFWSNNTFSTKMAKISKRIQATTKTIKSTTEFMDLELPKTLHELRREPIPASFPGRVDHATLTDYKVFVNPSKSEVLCTTTAEALAMGKFVIIPVHPSNTFFLQFDNCLPYRNKMEFAANLHWALNRDPEPLKPEQRQLLTWEAATERLVSAAAITRREAKERHLLGTSKLDERIAWFHNELGKGARGDTLRRFLGGGPISDQVAYSTMRQQLANGSDDDDDDEGLSTKFISSSLAQAIRKTLSNAIPANMASRYMADT